MYLEVIDMSFSLDGVLGAFAITPSKEKLISITSSYRIKWRIYIFYVS
jgi:hypothetical protein